MIDSAHALTSTARGGQRELGRDGRPGVPVGHRREAHNGVSMNRNKHAPNLQRRKTKKTPGILAANFSGGGDALVLGLYFLG